MKKSLWFLVALVFMIGVSAALADEPFTVTFTPDPITVNAVVSVTIESNDPDNTIQSVKYKGNSVRFTGDDRLSTKSTALRYDPDSDEIRFVPYFAEQNEAWLEIEYTDKNGNTQIYESEPTKTDNQLQVAYGTPEYDWYAYFNSPYEVIYQIKGVDRTLYVQTWWDVNYDDGSYKTIKDEKFKLTNDKKFTVSFTPSRDMDKFSFGMTIVDENDRIFFSSSYGRRINVLDHYFVLNEATFPDPVFRKYLGGFDTVGGDWGQGDGIIGETEVEEIKKIDVADRGITDLTGIEFLENLEVLDCAGNNLTSLDLSKNTKLKSLYCGENQLTSLKVNSSALDLLYCEDNNLTELDLSNCATLANIVKSNERKAIRSDSLSYDAWIIQITGGSREALSVDSDVTVTAGSFVSEPLKDDPSGESSGGQNDNILINETNFPDSVFRNYVTKKIDTNGDGIIDGAEIKATKEISVYGKSVSDLTGIEYFTYLEELHCGNNKYLSSLDVRYNKKLKTIRAEKSGLKTVLLANPVLDLARFDENKLTELDVSDCPLLADAVRTVERETHIETTGKGYDTWAVADEVGSTRWGLWVDCNVTVKAGSFVSAPTVEQSGGNTEQQQETKIEGVVINEANFPDPVFREYVKQFDKDKSGGLIESELSAVKRIDVYQKGVSDLTGIAYFTNLTLLDCCYNSLTWLDLSQNTKLHDLFCFSNQLTSLIVNSATLDLLYCEYNNLTTLDLTTCTNLSNGVRSGAREDCPHDEGTPPSDGWRMKGRFALTVDKNVTVTAGDFISSPLNGGANGGIRCDADGVWRYYENGVFVASSGIVPYEGNYFYVRNGLVDFRDGLVYVNGDWYLLAGGAVQFAYNGLYRDADIGWWLVQNGVVNFGYNGLFCDPNYGWWLIAGGQICWDYTGLWNDPTYGWWLIANGQVCFDYYGLWADPNYGWWLIAGGQVCWDYVGLWNDPDHGWWLIDHGTVAFNYIGLWCDPNYGWWLINGGAIAWQYNGLWFDPIYGGWWLIKDSQPWFDYTGLWYDQGNDIWWLIGGGEVALDYTGYWNDPTYGTWMITNGRLDWSYTGGF